MACPICQKLTVDKYTPFCSKACQTRDLLHWLTEDYRVPVQEMPEEEALETQGEETNEGYDVSLNP